MTTGITLIIIAVLTIVAFQFKAIWRTMRHIKELSKVFPDAGDYNPTESYNCTLIGCGKDVSPIFERILNDINKYLTKNAKSVADYHLMKDIVDRNVDTKENEIASRLPFPLYLGLVGTMLGIIIGLACLKMDTLASDEILQSVGAVRELLVSVACAMMASAIGVIATIVTTSKYNKALNEAEAKKDEFLSWIQAQLLPNVATNAQGVMTRMVQDLERFNDKFEENSSSLSDALGNVNETTKNQLDLMQAVENLNINKIAKANVITYEHLKDCMDDIEKLALVLQDSSSYLQQVRQLNEKLDANEERTKAIEKMSKFFSDWDEELLNRKGEVNKAVADVDDALQTTLGGLKKHMTEQMQSYAKFATDQSEQLMKKGKELDNIVTVLNQLPALTESWMKIQQSNKEIVSVITKQSEKLDDLARSIQGMANSVRQSGGSRQPFAGAAPAAMTNHGEKKNNKPLIVWAFVIGGIIAVGQLCYVIIEIVVPFISDTIVPFINRLA